MKRGGPLRRTTGLRRGGPLARRTRLRPVSAKRARTNRQRRELIAELWPGGVVQCAHPNCCAHADDVHEILTRARGGSITDAENFAPLCRRHHDELTFRPESELQWAYELGLLAHSWDAR